jgi:hypothetical protein
MKDDEAAGATATCVSEGGDNHAFHAVATFEPILECHEYHIYSGPPYARVHVDSIDCHRSKT